MQKEWIFPEKRKNRKNKDIVLSLLEKRGIIGHEAVEEFLSDRPQLTYDPFLLKNMEEAIERIQAALRRKEHICIYGDYDADGVCGVSLMMELFFHFCDLLVRLGDFILKIAHLRFCLFDELVQLFYLGIQLAFFRFPCF
jgi:hypothetical protein